MAQCIAVVNAGSSSVKFGYYDSQGEETLLVRGAVEQIGVSPTLSASDGDGNDLVERKWPTEGFTHAQAMTAALEVAHEFLPQGSTVVGVGHRVVHGGTHFAGPAQVTSDVIALLESFSPLAPLHSRITSRRSRQLRRTGRTFLRLRALIRRSTRRSRIWPRPLRCHASSARKESSAMDSMAFRMTM